MAEIIGTDAAESLTGAADNDILVGNGGNDTLDGGARPTFAGYWTSTAGVNVNLTAGTAVDGLGGTDTLINIRGVIGSGFDDTLLGSALSDVLNGSGGNDTIQGLDGDDELAGDAGNDAVTGGAGSDTAYFSGSRQDYTVTAIQGGFTVVDNRGAGGTDTVTEVEFFRFQGNDDNFDNDVVLSASALPNGPTAGDDYVRGGAGNDRIDGLAGNDTLEGWAGDDTLIGGLGDDVLTGFTGRDVAEMGDVGFRGVSVGLSDRGVAMTSAAGTDYLINIEVANFADGRLVFDAEHAAAKVVRLYEAALDRLPDQGGLNHWIDAVQDGMSLSALGSLFLQSPEFQSRFGGASADNGGYVDLLYRNVLGRAADADGLAHWKGMLDRAEVSRADMLVTFSESGENKAGTAALVQNGVWDRSEAAMEVARLYDTVLGRPADAGGLNHWKTALEAGTVTLPQLAEGFVASSEFSSRYGSLDNRGFVEAMYVNTLDRPSDQAGLDHWTAQLDAGTARSAVVLAFSESPEHVNLTSGSFGGENPSEYGIVFA